MATGRDERDERSKREHEPPNIAPDVLEDHDNSDMTRFDNPEENRDEEDWERNRRNEY